LESNPLEPAARELVLERSIVLSARAWVLATLQRTEEARSELLLARELVLPFAQSRAVALAHIDLRLAMLLVTQGRFLEAEAPLNEALAHMRADPEEASLRIIEALNLRALLSRRLGDPGSALATYREALEYVRHYYTREATQHAELYLNLAAAEAACGAPERELELLRRGLWIFERELGPKHQKTALCGGNLAGALTRQNRFAQAEEIYGRVLEMQIAAYGARHAFVGYSLRNLAVCALARNDGQAAADVYYEAGRVLIDAPGHEDQAIKCVVLAAFQLGLLGNPAPAEAMLLDALDEVQRRLPEIPTALLLGLADACEKQGRDADAQHWKSRAGER
jgi:tetratricopeptide (TPR) repeat protein